jgi:DNA-binding response OmpR family regulator
VSVLIVDDNFDLAENLAEILELAGIDALALGDPARAVESVRDLDLDLIVLDVRMPGMSGPTLHRRLRTSQGGARFALMSGLCDLDEVEESLSAGATLLQKPFDGQILVDMARAAGDARRRRWVE